MADNDLMHRFNRGEKNALKDLYEKYSGSVMKIIQAEIPEEKKALEILAEVFLDLWGCRDFIVTEENVQIYLYVMAHRWCDYHKGKLK